MRRLIYFFLLGTQIISCKKYDDTELWNTVKDHEARIAKLELLCSQMNTNMSSLQSLTTVLESMDYITNIAPIEQDGETMGYTISFAKSKSITIYNGKNGENGETIVPAIGIKKASDNLYYWTLNGEWILSDSGEMIRASALDGENGSSGITPKLKIEDGYWLVSYDEGATWERLEKATGEDGKDGDSFINSISEENGCVIITLADGTIITVPSGDSPYDPDIIYFEDPYVKAICIKEWDEDEDGELSYEEAKKVTSFNDLQFSYSEFGMYHSGETHRIRGGGTVGNQNIRRFRELQYFTSITEINSTAFSNDINLEEIVLPEGCTIIRDGDPYQWPGSGWGGHYFGPFSRTRIRVLVLPSSLSYIGKYAFEDAEKINELYCKAETPPTGEAPLCKKLFIPIGTLEAYQNSSVWKYSADAFIEFDYSQL